jgi:hypothetical protein
MRMLAQLGDSRVASSVPTDLADDEGVGVVATRTEGRVVALIHRFGGDSTGTVIRALRRAGYRRAGDLGVSPEGVNAFLRREATLPSGVAPPVRDALTAARAAGERAHTGSAATVALRLRVSGWPGGRFTLYRIDGERGNPSSAWARARRDGASLEAAGAAARRSADLTPASSGPGVPAEITLDRHAVVLLVLDAADRERPR